VVETLLADVDEPIGDLARTEIAVAIADALSSLGGAQVGRGATVDVHAVELAREYLAAHACEQTQASVLERVTGLDRFNLCRQFRRSFGTSPDRYRALRRLALARAAIETGMPLARAAAEAGFADQSHMTRQFKRAYGLTPGRWTALTAA
jgi:AraC-like DNA-binding protein